MIANCITVSRLLFSLVMIVFPPSSVPFAVLYVLCGVTDMLDGPIARKLHTESEKGAKLDSAADLIFAAVYAVRILPLLSVPFWIWFWAAVIAAVRLASPAIAGKRAHSAWPGHSLGNRVTGLLLFLLPLSAFIADVK